MIAIRSPFMENAEEQRPCQSTPARFVANLPTVGPSFTPRYRQPGVGCVIMARGGIVHVWLEGQVRDADA